MTFDIGLDYFLVTYLFIFCYFYIVTIELLVIVLTLVKRLMIHIDEEKCNGCGLCVPSCEEGALAIIDGKAKVVSESYCDGLGACIGHCPEGALTLEEVETVPFDEEAAMEHVRNLRGQEESGCCPTVDTTDVQEGIQVSAVVHQIRSRLNNFPVKLKLMAPNHPALRNASLLISADCTTIAYPALHEDFIKGRTVIQVCPKFEDYQMNLERLTQIFAHNEIRAITILIMEVPCCSGLVRMVKQALVTAEKSLPLEVCIIGIDGAILTSTTLR